MTAVVAISTFRRSRTWSLMLAGARDITPVVLGVLPFALAIGTYAGTSSLSTAQALVSGPAILAGSAQLTTIEMLDAGAAPLVIILSALIVNARLMLYSAGVADWFRDQPLRRRLVLALPIIDQLYLTCEPRFARGDLDPAERRHYFTGAALWLAGAWTAAQTLAILAGAGLPDGAGLQVAAPLALGGLLARTAHGSRATTAAMVAIAIVFLGPGLPLHSVVLVATIGGVLAGTGFPSKEVAS
jgi:predicted branched-subunit amino acid permease